MAVSNFLFGSMHVGVRHITQDMHPFEVAFFRLFLGLFVILPAIWKHGLTPFRTSRRWTHVLRALLNVVAMLSFFYALSITKVTDAQALSFTGPLFASVLAVIFLGEVIRIRRTLAIIFGFAGALIIVRPGFQEINIGMMLALVSAAIWGLTMIVIKRLTHTDSALTVTLYMLVLMSPMTLAAALPFWSWPTPEQWIWLIGIAALGTPAQFAFAQAFRLADTTVVLPLDFTRIVWGALFGWLFFGEVSDLWTWVGAAVIFSGSFYLAWREHQLALSRSR